MIKQLLTVATVSVTLIPLLLPVHCNGNVTMYKHHKVLVSSNDLTENALNILREHFTVSVCKYRNFDEEGRTLAYNDLLELIPGCTALVWSSNLPITKELLDRAGPSLKQVSTISAGYNHCNVDELKARGIKLTNTPNVLASAVAEVTIALMLGAARRFTENLQQIKSGVWATGFDTYLGLEIRGSTVGIIGLGGIGQTIVKRLSGFEVDKILYTGHREKPEGKALGAQFVSLNDLLTQSDFVILSVPLTNETRHMINRDTLAKMRSNSILINVGRGDLVEQEALYDALKNNQIYAAGLDVMTPEPLPKDHKLLTLPNLFVLPHIGSATIRTRGDMADLGARNVVNGLTGKPLLTPVKL